MFLCLRERKLLLCEVCMSKTNCCVCVCSIYWHAIRRFGSKSIFLYRSLVYPDRRKDEYLHSFLLGKQHSFFKTEKAYSAVCLLYQMKYSQQIKNSVKNCSANWKKLPNRSIAQLKDHCLSIH